MEAVLVLDETQVQRRAGGAQRYREKRAEELGTVRRREDGNTAGDNSGLREFFAGAANVPPQIFPGQRFAPGCSQSYGERCFTRPSTEFEVITAILHRVKSYLSRRCLLKKGC